MTVNTKKALPKKLIDSLLANYKKPEVIGTKVAAINKLLKMMWRMRDLVSLFYCKSSSLYQ